MYHGEFISSSLGYDPNRDGSFFHDRAGGNNNANSNDGGAAGLETRIRELQKEREEKAAAVERFAAQVRECEGRAKERMERATEARALVSDAHAKKNHAMKKLKAVQVRIEEQKKNRNAQKGESLQCLRHRPRKAGAPETADPPALLSPIPGTQPFICCNVNDARRIYRASWSGSARPGTRRRGARGCSGSWTSTTRSSPPPPPSWRPTTPRCPRRRASGTR
jgi:hypothetical protein